MSIQPDLTPAQQRWECGECVVDPKAAPRRACPPATCYCNHRSCHAYDPARVLIRGLPNVHQIPSRKAAWP